MNLLCLHQNYPGQFGRLTRALAERDGWTVVGIGSEEQPPERVAPARYYRYGKSSAPSELLFPPLQQLGQEVRRGRSVKDTLHDLKGRGFHPDLVIAHPAWGETIFLREIYPEVPFLAYLEYFYSSTDSDTDFDPEFPLSASELSYVPLRNIPSLLAFANADLCVTPTEWQASRFPKPIRKNLRVLHEGIETGKAAPDPDARLTLPSGRVLAREDEVITYVARSLEPYRGFHVFMRALPALLRRRPKAVVVVVGRDEVSYGRSPANGGSWRETLLAEVGDEIDRSRVFFLGSVTYGDYLRVLQVSTVHVYLSYPFVLSWSLIEALSTQCAVVASATDPVKEVVEDGVNGRLVDFFDRDGLVETVGRLLDDRAERARLGAAARRTARRYDFDARIYPRYRQLLQDTIDARSR